MFPSSGGSQLGRNRSVVRRRLTLRGLRRISQALSLGVFVLLLCIGRPISRALLAADPFAAALNALSTRSLYRGLVWSLVILIPTFFLGRFFCGWICPLGTLHQLASNIRSDQKRGRWRIDSNRYQSWQAAKYYVLAATLVAALCGSAWGGLLDPIALAVRSFALSLLPALVYLFNGGFSGHFHQAFVTALILFAILLLNLRITRLWCRAVCPLGALLGLASRWSLPGLEKDRAKCDDCKRCLLHCQGGDDPLPGALWHKAECHLCMNCTADCPQQALRFRFFPKTPAIERANLQRRKLLTGIAAGAASVPLLRANTGESAEVNPRRIRPPAALEEKAFLARCIRCGECMDVCPNTALQPALGEAGWEGLWTPVLVPRVGYCEPSCTACGDVCPTGAIWEFTLEAKLSIHLGTAFYDRGRCLPWSMATDCIVCEEWCPVSPKAIYLRPAEVVDAAGNTKQVRQPYIDPARCLGCGACEFACPVRNPPAVYVTCAGESRSPANQLLLSRNSAKAGYLPESGEAPEWTRGGTVREFAAADLWKYVDGDAERYLRCGVRRTVTAPYRHPDVRDAVADVHEMESAAGAQQLFDSESAAGSRIVLLGDSARSYGQAVTFRKGRFFVRIVGYQDSAATEPALLALAGAIEARLSRQ